MKDFQLYSSSFTLYLGLFLQNELSKIYFNSFNYTII